MPFDVALNLAWLGLGSLILALTIGASRRLKGRDSVPYWLQIACAVAIAGALFPFVSATDDLVRMEAMPSASEHQDTRNTGTSESNSNLLHLYQAAETFLTSRAIRIAYTPVFFAISRSIAPQSLGYVRLHIAGRSPPHLPAF